VTAVGDNTLTVQNPQGDSITVNVSSDTPVRLVESQSEGSLSDIKVGSHIRVRGQRNEDGSVNAQAIMVAPEGDQAGGRVTAVDGQTISVENPRDGAATIVTNDSTQFRLGPDQTGSLTDVTPDKFVMAFGTTQEDGSLAARLVLVHERGPGSDGPGHGPGHRRGPGGEVTTVGDNTLTVQNPNGDSVTVNVSSDTTVRLAETQSEGSLSDIKVGSHIRIRGQRNDDGSVTAQEIMVAPEGDQAGGRVTAVNGQTIAVENPKDGAATIVTNDSTQFRLGPDQTGSLADVTPDKMVMAFGTAQEDGSLMARLVLVHERGPGHGPK
jgi:hypothetical protein